MIECKHEKYEIVDNERVCCTCGIVLEQIPIAQEHIRHVQKDDEQVEKVRWGYGYPSSVAKFMLGTDRGYFNQNNIVSLCKVVYRIYRYVLHNEFNNSYVNFNDQTYLILLDRVLWHATHKNKSRFYKRYSNKARIITTLAILRSMYSYDLIKKRTEKMKEMYNDNSVLKCLTLLEKRAQDTPQLLKFLP
ncbi:MAG: hypothetical protein QXO37_09635 [Candidatus Nitrosocaldaceae archaeon]